jgi:membrane protein required for colicin V production
MSSSFNVFDAGLLVALAISGVAGYRAGLLRSVASILGYVSAAPIAIAVSARLSVPVPGSAAPWLQDFGLFFVIFLGAGVAISALLRLAVDDQFGPGIHPADRLAGAVGAARTAQVALTVVIVFDQILPAERQPLLLRESRTKPLLSSGARLGLQSLPPELTAFLDQVKRDHRI